MSSFITDPSVYKRDYNIKDNYSKSAAQLLQMVTGDDIDKCQSFVNDQMQNHWEIKNPMMNCLARRTIRTDRKKKNGRLLDYIQWIRDNKHVLSPSFITYINPLIEESFTCGYARHALERRSIVKKEAQAAKLAENMAVAIDKNNKQKNLKTAINSLSGAHSSSYNALYYCTVHTTLTGTTRELTSFANAVVEKLLSSNRHYRSLDVALENMAYIVSRADYPLLMKTMEEFNIRPPSVKEVYNNIINSTSKYWSNVDGNQLIHKAIENLNALQRTALMYVGDLNALIQINSDVIRQFYLSFLSNPKPVLDKAQQKEILDKSNDNDYNLATLLSVSFIQGKKIESLSPEDYGRWIGYLGQIHGTCEKYVDFIKSFLTPQIYPGDLYSIPTIKRRVVLGSDTDSSIFTTQRQVKWFLGKIDFSHLATQVSGVTSFLVSEVVRHTLANFSRQMGVRDSELERLKMKTEIYSKGMLNTAITKTYAMMENAEEGKIYKKPSLVIKGVILKAAKMPPKISKEITRFAEYCINLPYNQEGNNPLSPASIVTLVEYKILEQLRMGNGEFFKTEKVRAVEAYARTEKESRIVGVNVWNIIMGPRYGKITELPTEVLSLNVDLKKVSDIKEAADKIQPGTGDKIVEYFASLEKTTGIGNMLVPFTGLVDGHIPREVLKLMNERKMLFQLISPFYVILNSLGLNIANSQFTRFFSDDITKEQAIEHIPEDYGMEI